MMVRRWMLLLVCCVMVVGGVLEQRAAAQGTYEQWMQRYQELRAADRKVEADAAIERAIAIARRGGEPWQLIDALKFRAILLVPLGHYEEAQRSIAEAKALAEEHYRDNYGVLMQVEYTSGMVAYFLGAHDEAEQLYLRAMRLANKVRPTPTSTVRLIKTFLGEVYRSQGRLDEAERIMLELLPGARASGDPVMVLLGLAEVSFARGELYQSERYYREAWRASVRENGENHSVTASVEMGISRVFTTQLRWAEAKAWLDHAIPILERVGGPDSMELANALMSRASCIHMLGDQDLALVDSERSMAIQSRVFGADNPQLADGMKVLGYSFYLNGETQKGEAMLRRALALAEPAVGNEVDGTIVVDILINLARVVGEDGRWDEAGEIISRAIEMEKTWPMRGGERMEMWMIQGESRWSAGDEAGAMAALDASMESAEAQRARTSLSDTQRAYLFASYAESFEKKVEWESARGNFEEAFRAMERMRARAFVEELELSDRGLMAAGSEDDQQREAELRAEVTRLQAALDQTFGPERAGVLQDLRRAQQRLSNHWKDVRNGSDVYRELISSEQEFASVEDVRESLLGDGEVMLAYLFGHYQGYVAVITEERAEVLPIALGEAEAEVLGVEAGPLVNLRLTAMMMDEEGNGIVERMADPQRAAELTKELGTLWEVLVPAEVREGLLSGAYTRLVVLPDGALSFLPFEALVVGTTEDGVEYLLDAGPPVVYGPSATVMLNLERRRAEKGEAEVPVLTLGDPAYRLAASGNGARGNTRLNLARLPYSGRESQWVKDVFGKRGAEAIQLLGAEATEANLRESIEGRELVHLACHGMSDDAFGNLFGALALAPGRQAGNPEDDGLLTLAEIYELDLDACELAILSACVTNYGPQNQGEGTWALSRGFLVAGARRVVASNWVVDDEAGASLISYFCSAVAQAREKGEEPNYADCLAKAKRWVRGQEQWSSPFYWATFSLVGR